MEFAQIKYIKTVEGNYEVQLIHKDTVIARISFPTETLAAEYVDMKQKAKAENEGLLAAIKAKFITSVDDVENKIGKDETAVKSKVGAIAEEGVSFLSKEEKDAITKIEEEAESVKEKVESVAASIKIKAEKARGIDVSAKAVTQPVIDPSAKAAKDVVIDPSAKTIVS